MSENITDLSALSSVLEKAASELTEDDIALLIRALRAERAKFREAEAASKRPPKSLFQKAAPKGPIPTFEELDL
jgi:hypothetical protein